MLGSVGKCVSVDRALAHIDIVPVGGGRTGAWRQASGGGAGALSSRISRRRAVESANQHSAYRNHQSCVRRHHLIIIIIPDGSDIASHSKIHRHGPSPRSA